MFSAWPAKLWVLHASGAGPGAATGYRSVAQNGKGLRVVGLFMKYLVQQAVCVLRVGSSQRLARGGEQACRLLMS